MNELKVVSIKGQLVTDSRDVSKMIERPHSDLIKSIRVYLEYLGKGNFPLSDFFIESTYTNEQNKTFPSYSLTKKGCDMVANKMTGEKGVLFTAAYVTKFEDMEKKQNKPMSQAELILMQAKNVYELEQKVDSHDLKLESIEQKVDNEITLSYGEQRRLQKAVARRVYSLFSDKDDRPLSFGGVHREIKDRFAVASYKDLRRQDLQTAINYINNWIPKRQVS